MQQVGSTTKGDGWDDNAVLPAAVIIAQTASGRAEVNGVVVGKRFAAERRQSTCIRSADDGSLYMWSGYHLQLRRAQAEAYYLNIRGDSPSVFVIGRSGANGFVPERLTVSLDEAQNLDATELRDAGETVMRTMMPAEVYRWVEGFVLKHYEPRRKGGKGRGKKRSKALYDAGVGDQAESGGQT